MLLIKRIRNSLLGAAPTGACRNQGKLFRSVTYLILATREPQIDRKIGL